MRLTCNLQSTEIRNRRQTFSASICEALFSAVMESIALAGDSIKLSELDLLYEGAGCGVDCTQLPYWQDLNLEHLRTLVLDPDGICEPSSNSGTGRRQSVAETLNAILRKCNGNLTELRLQNLSLWPTTDPIPLPALKRLSLAGMDIDPIATQAWMSEMPTLSRFELDGITVDGGEYGEWKRIFDTIRNHPVPMLVDFEGVTTNDMCELNFHMADTFDASDALAMEQDKSPWDDIDRSLALYLAGKIGWNRSLRVWLQEEECDFDEGRYSSLEEVDESLEEGGDGESEEDTDEG